MNANKLRTDTTESGKPNNNPIPEVLRAARLLFQPGQVVEVRVPKAGRKGTISGYYDDFELLAQAVNGLEQQRYPGVYWTINRADPALLARSVNKLRERASESTSDEAILRRCWLPLDFDPKRLSGISATDAQHDAALEVALRAQAELLRDGWPVPIYADSGNGAHLLYAIDLPNDRESAELLTRVLKGLEARFGATVGDALIQVDQTMFNASRIIKIYGTTARKGDHTTERPHRISRILQVPEVLTPVSLELLQAQAAPVQAKPAPRPSSGGSRPYAGNGREFSLEEFLGRHGVRYTHRLAYKGGWKYQLVCCPFDASHEAPDACVFDYPDGYAFRCLHNSCHGRDWREFREHFEGPRPQRHYAATPPSAPWPADVRDGDKTPESAAGTERAEAALTLADVEAAADVVIEKKSSAEAMRLAPAIAGLRLMEQAIVVAKLRDGFGAEAWKLLEKWFDRALRDAAAALKGEKSADGDVTGQTAPPSPPAEEGGVGTPDLVDFPLTDSGNGQRLVAMFGKDLRFCNEMDSWLLWDGKRWCVDRANVMRHKVMEMARTLYAQCLRLPDGARRMACSKHALTTESSRGITNTLLEAQRMPGIPVSALELDQHPDHLNFLNGTVYLKDGSIKPPDRSMLITKLCEHKYNPKAEAPKFIGFAEWTMGGPLDGNPDAELSETTIRLVNFLQRVIGYSITGQVSETCVFVFYGADGANGKTTMLTLFRELLGRDYASILLVDTIMHARSTDNTAREDMADLRGTRFVQTSEISKEDRLNEGRVKYLTQGMGTIKSRRLHEHLIEFVATHKLLMDCNYRPKVTGQDNGIWRRLIQLPFGYTVPEEKRNQKLREELLAEAEGIIAWGVRGAMEWYRQGLGKPPEVTEASHEWQEHDDPLREFLDDWCEIGADRKCPVSDLMTAYLLWSKEYGEKFPLARRAFNEALAGKGIKQDRKHTGRYWVGVELKTEFENKLLTSAPKQTYI